MKTRKNRELRKIREFTKIVEREYYLIENRMA
jgi:hypothetical protein